jgi:hypothetical protein
MHAISREPAIDEATAHWLSERFADAFLTFAPDANAFHDDAFFDLNMPVWRFQLQGAGAFGEQLQKINRGPATVKIVRTIPTVSGFVTEQIEHQAVNGEDVFARRLWLFEVRDGRIAEATGYCTGDWDEALARRHAAEAPMLRP